ncbi:MAG: tyrosinase family protein [Daejeonella sp.]
MKRFITVSLFIALVNSFATSQVLPVIGVRINTTETAKDDYVGTSYITCNIRMFNGTTVNSDLPVIIRNVQFGTGGKFLISATGGTSVGAESINLTIKKDNTATNFFIKAKSGANSLVDKDAIIEVLGNATNSNGLILARKPLMITTTKPILASVPKIEMIIGSVSTIDDYLTWSPTLCMVRVTGNSTISGNLNVTIRNMNNSVGKVNFASSTLANNLTANNSSINLSLPNSGTWVKFFAAGKFGSPSRRDKDAVIEVVKLSTDTILSREAVMVRVRKNGNSVTVEERARFLNAIVSFNNTFNGYLTFNAIHDAAGKPEGHNGPGFLPWHRAFILDLERELQRLDPSVALLYWNTDNANPNIFSLDFMGSKPKVSSDSFADFNSSNPLTIWSAPGGPGIRRTTKFADGAKPNSVNSSLRSEVTVLALGGDFEHFKAIDPNPHGSSHVLAGSVSGDWMGTIPTAVKDPLFFFLHTNLDRLWAKWQWLNNRLDGNNVLAYSPQGTFPNTGTIHIGHYLNDTMWPWNGVAGTFTGSGTAPINQRPITAPGGVFPESIFFTNAPPPKPQLFNMIDYRNNKTVSSTNSGLGFCYDDVPFQ